MPHAVSSNEMTVVDNYSIFPPWVAVAINQKPKHVNKYLTYNRPYIDIERAEFDVIVGRARANKMNRALGPLCAHNYRLNWSRRISWGWWDDFRRHCPPDTWFEIRALTVWGRARYLSVTEAPHNTDFHTWMGNKHFLILSNRRDREPNPELWRERQRC